MADSGDDKDTMDDADTEKEPWLNSEKKKKLAVLIICTGALYWYFTRTEPPPTYYEIVKEVADKFYDDNHGEILATIPENIRVRKGTLGEHYIEFIKEIYTVVYVEGIGVQEVYPGQTIIEVKKLKDKDEIAMLIAKSPINLSIIKDRMRILGQLPEEEENNG